ncbi:MAG TPA: TonB-dependent receptor, partial [Gemmatimonadaceae bacterium]|nr:TonB-dependent receptor [Gemmatimonadaceae bacterium]
SYQNYHYNPTPEKQGVANRFFGFGCCAQIGSNRSLQDFTQKRIALRDDITWSGFQAGGQHIVKTGGNVDFLNYDIIKRNSEIPRFTYEPWFHAFEIPEKVEFQSGNPNFSTKNTQMGLYAQDDWTPTPKLTINAGVRWDYESGMLNYDHVTPKNIVDSLTKYANRLNGYPLDPKRYFTDGSDREPWKGAIQPRLGFSYSVDKAARTTLFGGWGIFVDRTVFDQAIEEKFALQHPSYTIHFRGPGDPVDANKVDWNSTYLTEGKPALDALIASKAANTAEVKLLPNDLRPPKSQQMSIGVRQLVGNWAIDVSWNNVRSSNVFTFYWANENFTCTPRTFACFQHNTIPGFGNILLADNKGKTWYNALQLKVDRQFRRTDADFDWGVGAAYTYARRETEGFNDDFSFPTPGDYPRQFRNDERGRMVANFITESARLWNVQFSGVLTVGSGARLDVGDRFGGAGNPLLPGGFATPTFTNLDLRLRKDFAIAAQKLGITVELFNALNAQNYGGFNTFNPNDGNFGRPSSVIGDPQRVQIGMEVTF